MKNLPIRQYLRLWLALVLLVAGSMASAQIHDFELDIIESDSAVKQLAIVALNTNGTTDHAVSGFHEFELKPGGTRKLRFLSGKAYTPLPEGDGLLFVQFVPPSGAKSTAPSQLFQLKLRRPIPLWLSLLPPLLTIFIALVTREVYVSLLGGIFLGALVYYGFQIQAIPAALTDVVSKYVMTALNDTGHLSVIVFSLLIGAIVALVSRNGGMAGVVQRLAVYARSARSTQLVTWLMGIAIFFDDYANSLIVGNTMRPISDRYRVSREKLSYIVDSTAAPIAAIAFVTTWIGSELGYIGEQTAILGIAESPYSIFINSLQYAFYPILTLGFVLMVITMRKDFGPMFKAEARARLTGELSRPEKTTRHEPAETETLNPVPGIRFRWYNAAIPVFVLTFITVVGLISTGLYNAADSIGLSPDLGLGAIWSELGRQDLPNGGSRLSMVIGFADSYKALLWGSFAGTLVAFVLSVTTRCLSFKYSVTTVLDGFRSMMPAVIILTLAWALASVTETLHTAAYITAMFSGNVSPYWIPALAFIMAALTSFSTGSSWNTMAILYPILLPATWLLSLEAGIPSEDSMQLFYNVTATVLAGSVFGDHCSPISDTTVLSSLACQCKHIDHVRTQLPYAVLVGAVSLLLGGFLFRVGLPWWVLYPMGFAGLYLVLRFMGRPVVDVMPEKGKVAHEPKG